MVVELPQDKVTGVSSSELLLEELEELELLEAALEAELLLEELLELLLEV